MELVTNFDSAYLLVLGIGVDGIGVGGRYEYTILEVGGAGDVTAVDEHVVVTVDVVVGTCLDVSCKECLGGTYTPSCQIRLSQSR